MHSVTLYIGDNHIKGYDMSFKPLHDLVVIKPLDTDEITKGGLYIPDAAKERPSEGMVMSVGTGHYEAGEHVPMCVAVGDQILYGKFTGVEIKIDGEELLILKESDIMGIIMVDKSG